MTPGTILFHSEFPFRNTSIPGRKLCIVLNNGSNGYYIVVKTTSKSHHYSSIYGCQPPPARHHAFYLPQATGTFPLDTWVQLDDFFRFDREVIINKRIEGIILIKFQLKKSFLKELLECALLSDDLLLRDAPVLQQTLNGL